MLGPARTVEEVPRPEEPLLTVDEEAAFRRTARGTPPAATGMIEAPRLARLEDADVDAELPEPELLALEPAPRAERLRRPPLGVPHVYDEPAVEQRARDLSRSHQAAPRARPRVYELFAILRPLVPHRHGSCGADVGSPPRVGPALPSSCTSRQLEARDSRMPRPAVVGSPGRQ